MNKIINHLLAKKDLKIEDIDQQIENFRLERQVKEEEDVKDVSRPTSTLVEAKHLQNWKNSSSSSG